MLSLLLAVLTRASPDSTCLTAEAEHWLYAVAHVYHAPYPDSSLAHRADSTAARIVTDPAVCRRVIQALYPGRVLNDSATGAPRQVYVIQLGQRGYVALFPHDRAGEWQMTYFVDRQWRRQGVALGI